MHATKTFWQIYLFTCGKGLWHALSHVKKEYQADNHITWYKDGWMERCIKCTSHSYTASFFTLISHHSSRKNTNLFSVHQKMDEMERIKPSSSFVSFNFVFCYRKNMHYIQVYFALKKFHLSVFIIYENTKYSDTTTITDQRPPAKCIKFPLQNMICQYLL